MSKTLANVKVAVRELLRDTNPSNYAVPTFEMDDCVQRRTHVIAGELRLGLAWTTPITLSANTYDYTLSGSTAQYHTIADLVLASQNWSMTKIDAVLMELYRAGTSIAGGDPYVYTLIEDASQDVIVRFYPTPNKADTVNVLSSTIPPTLVDATEIGFDNYAISALEYECAVELGLRPGVSLDPSLLSEYKEAASKAKYWSKVRLGRQRRNRSTKSRSW